jgi:hypothetical protein
MAWRWDNCCRIQEARRPLQGRRRDARRARQLALLRHHNSGGEWRVEKQRLRWDILDAFAEAAQQAGIPHSRTSTAATTKAWATSRSTRKRLALEHRQGLPAARLLWPAELRAVDRRPGLRC